MYSRPGWAKCWWVEKVSAEKWPRSVVRRRDEKWQKVDSAHSLVQPRTYFTLSGSTPGWLTIHLYVPAINTPRERSPRVNCTAGKCTQKDSSRVIKVGPEVSWGRRGRQTNLFKPKKATSVLCQSHTFKGKQVPSIHSDETQTISNLFQYYNKAEILLRPQHFIKGRKNLLG